MDQRDARAVELTCVVAFECECLHVGDEMLKRFIPPLIERLQTDRLQSADVFSDDKG